MSAKLATDLRAQGLHGAYYSPIHDGLIIDGEFISMPEIHRRINAEMSAAAEAIHLRNDWRICFRGGGE